MATLHKYTRSTSTLNMTKKSIIMRTSQDARETTMLRGMLIHVAVALFAHLTYVRGTNRPPTTGSTCTAPEYWIQLPGKEKVLVHP